ncbi:30S ribosomal protein S4 [Candidatus Woesearchaeota archaeon]|nr:30S ribosomal protein S4 [Candidatus Woesearchaeota archaeon]
MGDPKRKSKKYQKPSHPWQRARIEEERILMKDYSLKNKKELWSMHSVARKIALQAKNLLAVKGNKQAEKEKELLMQKLVRLNLIGAGQPIDAALALSYKDILERRLQTLVYRKSLARSMSQARQFITHRHIKIGDKIITSPAYIVSSEEEPKIQFSQISTLADENHPERAIKLDEPELEKIKPKEEAEEKTKESPKKEEAKKKTAKKEKPETKEKKKEPSEKKEEAEEVKNESKE